MEIQSQVDALLERQKRDSQQSVPKTPSSRYLIVFVSCLVLNFFMVFTSTDKMRGIFSSALNFLGRRLTQNLQIWSTRTMHVNARMWMKTVVTVFLCPTSRSTTTISMISLRMCRLTQSDQSKRQDFQSVYAFLLLFLFLRIVCLKIFSSYFLVLFMYEIVLCPNIELHSYSYTILMCTTNV